MLTAIKKKKKQRSPLNNFRYELLFVSINPSLTPDQSHL